MFSNQKANSSTITNINYGATGFFDFDGFGGFIKSVAVSDATDFPPAPKAEAFATFLARWSSSEYLATVFIKEWPYLAQAVAKGANTTC